MQHLLTIALEDVTEEERRAYKKRRKAARVILRDADGKIALLEVSRSGYWKLPGGGLDHGEDYATALARECREEVGCAIRTVGEVGSIIEYRDRYGLHQESHCYLAEVVGEKGEPKFEQDELDEGFRVHWLAPTDALNVLKASRPTTYEGPFIVIRDIKFLDTALKNQT